MDLVDEDINDYFSVHRRTARRHSEDAHLLRGPSQCDYFHSPRQFGTDEISTSDSHRSNITLGATMSGNDSQNHRQSFDHCHEREIIDHDKSAKKQLIAVSVLCFVFMVAEITG